MSDSIPPSWQDAAERWLKAYEETKAELERVRGELTAFTSRNVDEEIRVTIRDAGRQVCALRAELERVRARAEAAEARVRELEGALVRLIEFVEDDTCRHDEEKAGPLLIARAALSGKAGT